MTFRPVAEAVYRKRTELRALDTQISVLLSMIGQMEARLRRDGELSHANAHALNEYRVELAQRRKRYAEIAGPGHHLGRPISTGRIPRHASHVIVGDHDPERRRAR